MPQSEPQQDIAIVKAQAKEAYDNVVERAKLADIKLVSMDFSVKPKFYEVVSTEAIPDPIPTSSFEGKFESFSYSADDGLLLGELRWAARMKQGRSKLFSMEGLYLIVYEDVPPVEERHALAFLQKVGRFATYPYFRALVSRMSSEAGMNLPPLPILK